MEDHENQKEDFRAHLEHDLLEVFQAVSKIAAAIPPDRIPESNAEPLALLQKRADQVIADVCRKLAERRQAESALRAREEKYRLLIDNLPNVVFTGYKDWSTEFINNKIEILTGYPLEVFNSREMNWMDIVVPEDLPHIRQILIQALKTDRSYIREYRIRHKSGEILWIQEASQVVLNEAGDIDHISGTFINISERKWAEEALQESKRQMADIINFLPDATFVIDREGKVIAWNRAMEELTCIEAKDILGHGDYEYSLPFYGERRPILIDLVWEPLESLEKKYSKLKRKGQTIFGEAYTPNLKSGRKYLLATAGALYDSRGEIVGAIEVIRDISERKKVEEALSQQNEYLSALHDTTLALLNRLDLNDLLANLISRAGQLLGTPHGYIFMVEPEDNVMECKIGVGVFQQYVGMRLQPGEGLAGKVWQSGQLMVVDDYDAWAGRFPQLQNNVLHASICVPLKSASKVMGVLGLTYQLETNRTFGSKEVEMLKGFAQLASVALDNARLFTEAQEARQAAEAANKAKSGFLANMSHELRTPLNAIIGYSEMLVEDAADMEPEEIIPDLHKIHGAGKHLLTLINDILDLSKIEAGKMELYLEDFDLLALIEEVASTIKPLIEQKANTLEIHCGNNLGMVHSDLTKIRQCLFNLLSNASKFTEQGTIALLVDRTPEEDFDWLTFSVRDSGIGMSSEQMEKLFQAFSQADTSTTRKFGGTGLGLAITKRFSQMMGGDISVESEPGVGTTFTLRLPAHVAASKSEIKVTPESPPEPASEEGNLVLVIDDDPDMGDLMRRFLSKEGMRVRTALGGEEGLRLARELRPDIITLDVMMPSMDGWTVLTALKTDSELAQIPVIIISMLDEKNLGYSLGTSDYLIKPIDRDRLIGIIKKYIQTKEPLKTLVAKNGGE
jgi:hypothetical protein